MDTETTFVLLKGAMDFVSILAVGDHATLAKSGRGIEFYIREKKPLIGIPRFYFFFGQ